MLYPKYRCENCRNFEGFSPWIKAVSSFNPLQTSLLFLICQFFRPRKLTAARLFVSTRHFISPTRNISSNTSAAVPSSIVPAYDHTSQRPPTTAHEILPLRPLARRNSLNKIPFPPHQITRRSSKWAPFHRHCPASGSRQRKSSTIHRSGPGSRAEWTRRLGRPITLNSR